jgi:hypothetical protein
MISLLLSLGILLGFLAWAIWYLSKDPDGKILVAKIFFTAPQEDTYVDRIYTFATASHLTKYDVVKDPRVPEELSSPDEKLKFVQEEWPWYYDDNPGPCNGLPVGDCYGPKVRGFIKELDGYRERKQIQGYEFYESTGAGSRVVKRGLTWKVTVQQGSEFSRNQLIDLYQRYWGRMDGIYVEEFNIPPSRRR